MVNGEIPSGFRTIIIRVRKRRVRKCLNNKGKNKNKIEKESKRKLPKQGREEPNINK